MCDNEGIKLRVRLTARLVKLEGCGSVIVVEKW
jgi:hypothetical protein